MLSIDVLEPTTALAGFGRLNGFGQFGLGAYEEGICKEGKDFICQVKEGLFSCQPCDFEQLSTFKELQYQVARMAYATGLSKKLAAFKACVDKNLQPINCLTDGRIGGNTVLMLGAIYPLAYGKVKAPDGLMDVLSAATDDYTTGRARESTMRKLATVSSEMREWLRAAADAWEAPVTLPPEELAPPSTRDPTGPMKPPANGGPALPKPPMSKTKKAGLVVGALGLLTAIGLVATAHYYRKQYA